MEHEDGQFVGIVHGRTMMSVKVDVMGEQVLEVWLLLVLLIVSEALEPLVLLILLVEVIPLGLLLPLILLEVLVVLRPEGLLVLEEGILLVLGIMVLLLLNPSLLDELPLELVPLLEVLRPIPLDLEVWLLLKDVPVLLQGK